MQLSNGAVLLVESHAYAVADPSWLSRFDLWCACADEHPPGYAASSQSMTLWCPLDDVDPPRRGDLDKARSAAGLVAEQLSLGRPVLVTCAMGLNRSSLVAGLALRQLGLRGKDVVSMIRSERGQYALSNQAYRKAVLRG